MQHQTTNPTTVYWLDKTLYLNITNKCSNNCYFCFRKFRKGIKKFNLKLEKEPTKNEIIEELRKVIKRKNWKEIVFCGFGEPLERLDIVLQLTRYIKNMYYKPIRVDTNGQGYLLNKGTDIARKLKNAGVDEVRVSLNAHNKETYNEICKPTSDDAYENILKFIQKAKQVGLETEITVVTVPEVSITKIKELAEKLGVKFTIREYVPFFW
jgi:TatD family-associated radical SAM protein